VAGRFQCGGIRRECPDWGGPGLDADVVLMR
jgi:hypothetical protein